MIFTILNFFAAAKPGDSCNVSGGGFFGFPHWYEYLSGQLISTQPPTKLNIYGKPLVCTPQLGALSDVWLIVAAVIDILLRLAALVAVFGVVYGGIMYITSQGEAENVTKARKILQNAFIGLVIAIIATATVSFIAGRFAANG